MVGALELGVRRSLAEIDDCEGVATNSGRDLPDPVRTRRNRAADDRAHPPSRSGALCGSRGVLREGRRLAAARGGARGVDRRVSDSRVRAAGDVPRAARLRVVVPAQRIAVVQTCDLYANIFGLPGAALAGVPVRIGSRRELNPDKTAGQIRLQRHAYRCATTVVANSAAARTMLEQEGLAHAIDCGHSQRNRRERVSVARVRMRASAAARRAASRAGGHHRRQPAAREEPRNADRRRRAARRRLPRRAVPDRRRRSAPCGARSARRALAASSAASSFSAIARTSRRCSARPTSSCCPRGPRRFPTAPSKRWPPACRWSRAPSAACSI